MKSITVLPFFSTRSISAEVFLSGSMGKNFTTVSSRFTEFLYEWVDHTVPESIYPFIIQGETK